MANNGDNGPYVVVGHSLGALVARLFAGCYPDETAGIVFIDHALLMRGNMMAGSPGAVLPPSPSGLAKNEPLVGPKPLGLEDDPNFSKLPTADREAHLWFMTQTRNQKTLQTNAELMPTCFEDADAIVKEHTQPLGNKAVVNVDTPMTARAEIQKQLLFLSRNSKEIPRGRQRTFRDHRPPGHRRRCDTSSGALSPQQETALALPN